MQLELNLNIVPSNKELCMMCHLSSECLSCCKFCNEKCNSCQVCGFTLEKTDMCNRLDGWYNIIKSNVRYKKLYNKIIQL
jgi:hypothetical protein